MENGTHRRKHRHSIADASQSSSGTSMCLGHFETCCRPTSRNVRGQLCAARRCWAIYRQLFFATKHQETISMHALKMFVEM